MTDSPMETDGHTERTTAMRMNDPHEANQSYIRCLAEIQQLQTDFERCATRTTEDVAVTVQDIFSGVLQQLDGASAISHIQKMTASNVHRMSVVFSRTRTAHLAAASNCARLIHQNALLTNQLRSASVTTTRLSLDVLRRRRAAVEYIVVLGDMRQRLASADALLNVTQQRIVDLSTENDTLKKRTDDLSGVVSQQAATYERNSQFFTVLSELVANYETQRSVRDTMGNCATMTPVITSSSPRRQQQHVCSLCLNQAATVVARPCNHLFACAACACTLLNVSRPCDNSEVVRVSDIVANNTAFRVSPDTCCPRCRANIQSTLYVYV